MPQSMREEWQKKVGELAKNIYDMKLTNAERRMDCEERQNADGASFFQGKNFAFIDVQEAIDRIFKESVSTDTPERKQGVSCQHKGRKEPAKKGKGGR